MNDTRALLAEDLASVYIGNLNTVERSLTLPVSGPHGSAFSWESDEERFIDKEGRVHRPLFGMGDRKVHLTVTAALDGFTEKRVFEANVLQEKKDTVITEIPPVIKYTSAEGLPVLPRYVAAFTTDGRTVSVPVRWNEESEENGAGERVFAGSAEGTDVPAKLCIRKRAADAAAPAMPAAVYPDAGSVKLLPGSCFYEAAVRMEAWLLSADIDQMLFNFRRAAGLDPKGAQPMTGWDAPEGNLRGHTTGHFLSGLALAYSVTGDPRFKEKIAELVNGLAECQEAFAAGGRTAPGFLSAYDETQFDLLEVYTPYPQIWAPYYTLDKIMSGLYDAYTLAGNETAFQIEGRMGDWVYDRLSRLAPAVREKMWSMYIAGEYGGMLGTMVSLFGLTRREQHLLCASFFLNPKLFDPLEAGRDILGDMHANQHIPQILGLLAFYGALGSLDPGKTESEALKKMAQDRQGYFLTVKHFLQFTIKDHLYVNGGVGETEMFHHPGSARTLFTDKNAESCATYNMNRLYAAYFRQEPSGRLMDIYENALVNHILMSASHAADGGTTYFMPLRPGGKKEYSTEENTCCHGTGMESRFRYIRDIYAFDGSSLYVNLYVPSVLKTDASELCLKEETEGTFVLAFVTDCRKAVRMRVPAWAGEDFAVSVNGSACAPEIINGYAVVPGGFSAGDEIRISFRYTVRRIGSGDGKTSLAYGPYLLAALSEKAEYMTAPFPENLSRSADGSFISGKTGIKMLPAYRVDREAYHLIME